MAHDSELIILDVRTFQAYQAGHITGAMSIPLHEISRNASKIPQNKKIVVYCKNALCSMSTQAALELINLGFQNIHKLEGGFDEWKVIGYPIGIENKHLPTPPSLSYRSMTIPMLAETKGFYDISQRKFISSDEVVEFLENQTPKFKFDYVGYEIKTVEKINAIYLMINPDPRNFALVPDRCLVICHHKISVYRHHVYESMLENAKEKNFNCASSK